MKLCIILGAGASKPYGYPLGYELKQRIIQYCLSRPNSCAPDGKREDTWRFLEIAAQRLDESPAQSIDTFLEGFRTASGDEQKIGQHAWMAVAAVLFSHERPRKQVEGWWYHEHLRRHLNNRIHSDPTGPLNIVTFNYDRTLEYYVSQFLNPTLVEGVRIFQRLVKVQHVYGSLNPLPSFGPSDSEAELRYGESFGHDAWKAREAFKFIHDDPDSRTVSVCRSTVQDAETLLILGFGFDHTNITRLGLNEPNDQLIISSGYKLDRDTKQRVRATCFSKRIHFGKDTADISTFLTDTKILEDYSFSRTRDDLWNHLGSGA